MRRIGLLGGMSWESTLEYYRLVNRGVHERLGGQHSARVLLDSVDFQEVVELQDREAWDEAGALLLDAGRRLEAGGADFVVLCTNTMHRVAGTMEEGLSIPLLHIADALGERLRREGIERVGLLGTRFTMEGAFYRERLAERHGCATVIPEEPERRDVHRIIYDELCHGVVRAESRRRYLEVIGALAARGAEGVVLGCTEIGMLVAEDDVDLPVFDTTRIHAEAAVERALA